MSKPKTKTAKNPDALKPGRHGFGGGLWLTISKTGGRSWSYRFTHQGRARAMGLGGFPLVSLEQARVLAAEARKLARSGVDPIEQRNGAAGHKGRAKTFREVAEALIADLRHSMAQPEVRSAVASFAGRICLSSARRQGRSEYRQARCRGLLATDLDGQARNGAPRSCPYRADINPRDGPRFAQVR